MQNLSLSLFFQVFYCLPTPTMNTTTFTKPIGISLSRTMLMLRSNQSLSYLSSPTYIPNQTDSKLLIRNQSMIMASKLLATAWREIQGLNNWENLVEPLDPLLRQEIIRYGEFVATCYKAFDLDPNSKRYLNFKYGKRNMFKEVGVAESGYEVTKYIYATAPSTNIPIPIQTGPGSSSCRWIGYVATSADTEVATLGRRDIVVSFRGTVTTFEWMANLMSSLTPAQLDPHDPRPEVKVEAGFLSLYTSGDRSTKFGVESCRDQLLSEISRLIRKHRDEEMSITIAGHSMGSSLAHLLAYDIAELGLNNPNPKSARREIPVTVFSFGGPRVGNSGFKERCEELGVKVLRIVNVNDPITKVPGLVFNENFRRFRGTYEFPWSCSCYAHVGVELLVDFFRMHDPSCVHDLENYIGLLRCPKRGPSLMDRAKGLFSGGVQSFDAALNTLNLVQSQWT